MTLSFPIRPGLWPCRRRRPAGFTLVETMVASGIMGLFVMACFAGILFNQVAARKAKEQAIVMDFLTHYVENVKALPFDYVLAGQPINSLYNGAGGAPEILIPDNSSWVRLDTPDYETFDPDLLWLANRNPAMKVVLTQNVVGGQLHDIEVNVTVAWDAPLAKGGRLQEQLDLFRTKDL